METKNLLKSLKRRLSWMLCLVAFLMVGQSALAYELYVDLSKNKEASAVNCIYSWGSKDNWVKITEGESMGNDIYKVSLPDGNGNMIFLRKSSSATCGNWDNEWNRWQTSKPSDKNFAKPNMSGGSWDNYTPSAPNWTLTGSFNSWDITSNVFSSGTTSVNLTANNTYEFKVTKSGTYYGNSGTMNRCNCSSWTMSSSDNTNCKITADVTGSYTFTWDETNKKISVTYPANTATYYVAGNGSGNWCDGKDWDPAGSKMSGTPASITFNNVTASSDLKFKVTDGTWNNSWGHGNYDSSCSSGVSENEDGGNVKLSISKNSNITITFDGCKICVTAVEACTPPSISSHPSTTDATYCQNADATALSVTASGTTPLSYQWQKCSTQSGTYTDISGATSSSYTPVTTTAGTTYYKCKVTGQCGDPAVSNASGAITIVAPPSATITGGTKIDCNTTSVTLTAGTDAASATYLWSTGATTQSITVSDGGTYYVTVTNTANGCSQKSDGYVVTKDTTKPTATISGGTKIDCNTASVTLTAETNAASATYLWSTGATTQSITVSDAGTYYVTVTNTANGCSQKSADYVVTKDTTKPTATISGGTKIDCNTASVTLTAGTNASSATYLWSTGATTASITVSDGGTYYVTVTNTANGCSQKSDGYVVTKDITKPTITGTTPASGCVNSDVTISASASAGATVRWYSQQTGGDVLSTGADYVIRNLASSATYWAEAYNSTTGCVSEGRTSVEATVKAQTIARTDANSFNTVVDGSSAATNLTFTQCGYTITEGSITLVGADAGDFTINSKTISGESITVNVTFHPTTTGSKTVYVQILDASHQFQITATGACKSGVAASNFNFTNKSVTYNGSEQKPTITPKDATVGAVTTVYYAGAAATGKTDAGTYAITIDSEAGTKYCGASKLSLGNFVINKAPQATLTLNKDKSYACVNGGSIQFFTEGGSGDGAVTYTINSGTGGSITNAGVMTATQAGEFTVQATKAASANYQAATSANTITVNFYADPTSGNITASPASPICKGTSTTLTIAGYTAGSTLQWYKGSSILTGKTSASYSTENLSEAATYKVVVSNNGCTSETAPITINVQEPTLTIALTSAAGADNVYVWEPATFTPTTNGTITAKTITQQSGSGNFIVEDGANDAKIVKAGGENDVFRASFTANLNGCTKTVTKDVTVEKATEDCSK